MTVSQNLFADLAAAVQHNCDLIDARHARDSGLCTYLLGMREYFRWARGLQLGAAVEPGAVSSWIAKQEQHWESLLDHDCDHLIALPVQAGVDAFEEEAVNRLIAQHQLIYGAGIGRFGVPLFFLARCESIWLRDGVQIVVAGEEFARGFVAPPAVSRESLIILRLDALRRWLWTRAETALTREPTDAFRLALSAYDQGGNLQETIERMASGELESLVLYELGELRAGRILGSDWEPMLDQLGDRRAELVVRAVRDLLADCTVTLPVLLERHAVASLHFWFSNFDGMRRALAPEFLQVRANSDRAIDVDALRELVVRGQEQWNSVGRELLSRWRAGGREAVAVRTTALCPA